MNGVRRTRPAERRSAEEPESDKSSAIQECDEENVFQQYEENGGYQEMVREPQIQSYLAAFQKRTRNNKITWNVEADRRLKRSAKERSTKGNGPQKSNKGRRTSLGR